jgi:hypothetical protein
MSGTHAVKPVKNQKPHTAGEIYVWISRLKPSVRISANMFLPKIIPSLHRSLNRDVQFLAKLNGLP